jgi:hypothetical protein
VVPIRLADLPQIETGQRETVPAGGGRITGSGALVLGFTTSSLKISAQGKHYENSNSNLSQYRQDSFPQTGAFGRSRGRWRHRLDYRCRRRLWRYHIRRAVRPVPRGWAHVVYNVLWELNVARQGGSRLAQTRKSTSRAFHWLSLPVCGCLATFNTPNTL